MMQPHLRLNLQSSSPGQSARGVAIELSTDAFFAAPHLHGFKIGYAYPRPVDLARGLSIAAEKVCRQLETP
jgi:hypothetical protein